jgi:hypothetical protein
VRKKASAREGCSRTVRPWGQASADGVLSVQVGVSWRISVSMPVDGAGWILRRSAAVTAALCQPKWGGKVGRLGRSLAG